MNRSIIAITAVAWTGLVGCSRLEASRNFEAGKDQFEGRRYESAVFFFRRALAARPHPVIRFNLAVAHIGRLRRARSADDWATTSTAKLAEARDAIKKARTAYAGDERRLGELDYLEGCIERSAGREGAARAAFESALERIASYRPALKALVELAADPRDPLVRLVLASTPVEEPKLIDKLPP